MVVAGNLEGDPVEVLAFWFLFAIVVGVAAGSRGRSGFGWFLLSMIISPLIGLLLVLVLPNRKWTSAPTQGFIEPVTPETHVRCPACRELVRADASKCKHCGTTLVPRQISA